MIVLHLRLNVLARWCSVLGGAVWSIKYNYLFEHVYCLGSRVEGQEALQRCEPASMANSAVMHTAQTVQDRDRGSTHSTTRVCIGFTLACLPPRSWGRVARGSLCMYDYSVWK